MMRRLEAFFEKLTGRLPIGWLQLVHNKMRFGAALAGVAFADILILMQLGFMGGLVDSIKFPYHQMSADLILSASDMNTLADGGPVPRQRMYEALAVSGVKSASPLYYGKIDWKQPDGTVRTLDTFGIDPARVTFATPEINAQLDVLKLPDMALLDRRTRNVPKAVFQRIDAGQPITFEAKGRTLTVEKLFSIGGGMTTDGYLIVSDQTFLNLFPQRAAGAPNHILLRLEAGVSRDAVAMELRQRLPAYDTAARTIDEAITKDTAYQTTQRPVGIVFGFGVAIGILVGCIIVYQVLSTDVADHIREYATFKAIGYPQSFFLGIVFEEALILAVFGFIPGVIVAMLLYALVSSVTGLPLNMTLVRAISVLIGTMAMCMISGAVATRKLARANPADLF
ncbi:MAG: ABC transporter permease DevC [Hyphomicrobiaceae bacterium]